MLAVATRVEDEEAGREVRVLRGVGVWGVGTVLSVGLMAVFGGRCGVDGVVEAEGEGGWGEWVVALLEKYGWVLKLLIALLVVAAMVLGIVAAAQNAMFVSALRSFAMWVCRLGAVGPLVYAGGYAVATVLFLPGSLLTIVSGVAFSTVYGTFEGFGIAVACVFVGASVGAIVSFLLARYAGHEYAVGLATKYKALRVVYKAVERGGWKTMCLLRLSPVVPFNGLNYISGILPISFVDYCASLPAMLPGVAAYVWSGVALGSVARKASFTTSDATDALPKWLQYTLITLGVVTTVAAVSLLGVYARNEILRIAEEDRMTASIRETQHPQNHNRTLGVREKLLGPEERQEGGGGGGGGGGGEEGLEAVQFS